MIWPERPEQDDQPAEMQIGQPDFGAEGRNAKGAAGAATLNVPTGIAAMDGILAVADAWNHRVLIWHGYPRASNQPADVVLGQADFTSASYANRADSATIDAATLNWCYGVTIADGRLFAAAYLAQPARAGCGSRYRSGTERRPIWCSTGGISPAGTRMPGKASARSNALSHAVVLTEGALMIADAGNNRVMVWRSAPTVNGAPCDFVLGQAGQHQEYNAAAYYPTAATVNMPMALRVSETVCRRRYRQFPAHWI